MNHPLLLTTLLVAGILPSGLFFLWIEQNCYLPWISDLHWYWKPSFSALKSVQTIFPIFWNFGLFALFGILHSGLAQPEVRNILFTRTPDAYHRAIYVIVTGVYVTLLMASWQHMDYDLWDMLDHRHHPWLTNAVSGILFCLMYRYVGAAFATLGLFNMVGLQPWISPESVQSSHSKNEPDSHKLITDGLYKKCRHPVYLFTLLSMLLTPHMTFDRLLVLAFSILYLLISVPIEERKLVKEFGPQYLVYKKNVPAVVPKLI